MAARVSLAMLAEKDSPTLERCLASVADLVDEIVVVTQPNATKDWITGIRRFDTKLVEIEWPDSFAAARNESLKCATGDWIFYLDADEWLDEENGALLRNLLDNTSTSAVGYTLGIASLHAEGNVESNRQVRLFRNAPGLRWKYRLHEQILPALKSLDGAILDTEILCTHDGYCDRKILKEKQGRNFRLLKLDLQERPNDPFVLFNAGVVALDCRQPVSAIKLLEKSRRIRKQSFFSPPAGPLYSALARSHTLCGNTLAALEICRQGQAEIPDDPDLLFAEGTLRFQAADHVAAEGLLMRCVRRCPAKSAAWQVLADLYIADRRFDDVARLVASLKENPVTSVDAALAEARLLFARRETASAIDILENEIGKRPRAILLHDLLLTILASQSHPRAVPAAKRLLVIDPASRRARAMLANQQFSKTSTGRQIAPS